LLMLSPLTFGLTEPLRDVDAFFVIAEEASPLCHPAEDALDDPAARQNRESPLVNGAADSSRNQP
jgi:hypothetical protein